MNCRDTLLMLSGYMDGEIDLVHRLEIERHLENCADCTSNLESARTAQTALKSRELYEPAPPGVRSRVLAAVRAAEQAQRPFNRPFVRPAFGAAAFAALLMLCWLAVAHVRTANHETLLTQQVTCSHVHSLMANHLLDISSSDPHGVVAWFGGKLDYAPPVIDLKAQGYPLLGGRLDYLNDRSVAALVYTRQKHVINLFFWPAQDQGTEEMREENRHGYRICRWTMGATTICAVSDLSAPELRLFAEAVRTHTSLGVMTEECH